MLRHLCSTVVAAKAGGDEGGGKGGGGGARDKYPTTLSVLHNPRVYRSGKTGNWALLDKTCLHHPQKQREPLHSALVTCLLALGCPLRTTIYAQRRSVRSSDSRVLHNPVQLKGRGLGSAEDCKFQPRVDHLPPFEKEKRMNNKKDSRSSEHLILSAFLPLSTYRMAADTPRPPRLAYKEV